VSTWVDELSRSLALLTLASASAHGDDRADTMVGSVQQSWIDGSTVVASTGTVDWMHPFGASMTAIAGAAWMQVGDYSRTLGHIGGSASPADHYTAGADVYLGPVRDGGSTYDYLQASVQGSREFTSRNWVAAEDRLIAAGPLHGQLVSAAWTSEPGSKLSLELKQMITVSGNLNSQASSARLDYVGATHLLVGAAVGRTAPKLLDTLSLEGGRFSQYYCGLGRLFGRTTLTGVVNRYVMTNSGQWSATLIASVPLAGRR